MPERPGTPLEKCALKNARLSAPTPSNQAADERVDCEGEEERAEWIPLLDAVHRGKDVIIEH